MLTVSGCGTNRDTALNDNTVNRHNVSTNDMGRTDRTDLRTVGTDRNGDLRINRDNGLWPDRNDRNVGLRTNPDNALPARNARGYISPNPVSFTPTGGYTRLCPCPNQATPNTTTPGTTTTPKKTTTPGTTTAPGTQATGGTVDATEARVVELTNAERRKKWFARFTSR
ncbi:hypothetical protein GCM10020331_072930 [Ectobacillus funiculus]